LSTQNSPFYASTRSSTRRRPAPVLHAAGPGLRSTTTPQAPRVHPTSPAPQLCCSATPPRIHISSHASIPLAQALYPTAEPATPLPLLMFLSRQRHWAPPRSLYPGVCPPDVDGDGMEQELYQELGMEIPEKVFRRLCYNPSNYH
ncbi:unnamed protein product, partial [Urochloa humidicola]